MLWVDVSGVRTNKEPDKGLQCYNRRKNCHAHLQGKHAIMAKAAILCSSSSHSRGASKYLISVWLTFGGWRGRALVGGQA